MSAQSYINQHLMQMVNSSKQEEESKVTQGANNLGGKRGELNATTRN
ncbi:hypothetical protein [Nostoc sp.]